MKDCVFCKIVDGKIDAEIVYEDDYSVAFLDANPVAPGHTVVIPKTHSPVITDMDDEDISAVFSATRRVIESIDDALDPDGFNYGVNHGKAGGQAIDHLHVHVLPRFEGDQGGSMHAVVRNPPKEQSEEEIAGQIREAAEFDQAEPTPAPAPEKPQPPEPDRKPEPDVEEPDDDESGEEEGEGKPESFEQLPSRETRETSAQESEEETPEPESELEEEIADLDEELKEHIKELKRMRRP